MNSKANPSTLATLAMWPNDVIQGLGIRSGELLLTPPQMSALLQTSHNRHARAEGDDFGDEIPDAGTSSSSTTK